MEPSEDFLSLYLDEVGRYESLSTEEEEKLGRAGTKEAQTSLVLANLKLVVNISRSYMGRGISLMDLIQEGNRGLMRAAEKYDPDKGQKFGTYAAWWIRRAMTKALPESRLIRLPTHVAEEASRLERFGRQLTQEEAREISDEDIAARADVSIEHLRDMERATRTPASLDRPLTSDSSSSLAEFVEDYRHPDPETAAIESDQAEHIAKALKNLKPMEALVIKLRYGLDGQPPLTLVQTAMELEIPRDRVRALESSGLKTLKDTNLRNFLT